MSRDLDEPATLFERPQKEVPVEVSPPVSLEPDQTVVRPLARPTSVGDVIAEKYRLVRTLGRGGMGRIFAADHLLLGTTVALKFMHPHLARDRGQVARFAREARAAATLKSTNVARIIDVDQLPTGELYIVMEYLEGVSLETMAVDGRGLPIADAVMYVVQACDALAEAHSRSIIHRDVKPANLFLTKGKSGEPLIKVLDFGLAKSMVSTEGFSSSASTLGGQALGTPYYMSPEQITGNHAIDGRSDVWAIGATLYELLTGQLAFPGANAPIVFDHILKAAPVPLRALRPDVPEPLAAIVDRCLMQDVTARFQTVRELTKALESTLTVMSEPAPFVAAPLSTERFMRSSAPPSLMPPMPMAPSPSQHPPPMSHPMPPPMVVEPAVRATAHSFSNIQGPPSFAEPEPEPAGPSVRQMVLAALAGPALIAVAAGVVALVMWTSPGAKGGPGAPGVPNKVVYLSAKSSEGARSKAPAVPVPEKAERPRK